MRTRFDLRRQRNRYKNTWRVPSVRYQQESDNLWRQYLNEHIDYVRYLELLEAIKTEEIDRHDKKYPFSANNPKEWERIENGIWEYEHRLQNTRAKEARQKAEAARIQSLTPLEKYLEETPETIKNFRTESNSYRNTANFYQILIIAGSVLTTSASSAVVFGVNGIWRLIAPAISIVVTISAGLTAYFKFKERSFNLQQTADAIEQECIAVGLGIGYYRDKKPQEALQFFAERVELLKDEQKKRQQQLEQPPELKHGQHHL